MPERKQQRFVAEYLIDLNATAAYKRAGYEGKGKSAENAASRMLGNVGVQLAVTAAMQQRGERTGITADQVIREIERMAVTREAICIGVLLFRYFPSP
ncbi:hypothetical protein CR105_03085 [Massilia eurypsychrophila]|uniref:Terminase small subunit n=1 Tax=Massilia eurypsychrophila TaxID=1485217 RepID=A0A2G8TJ67_9BURK|nr:hypothetical protein CR105_03085 [Massilia eurypsychrophila]